MKPIGHSKIVQNERKAAQERKREMKRLDDLFGWKPHWIDYSPVAIFVPEELGLSLTNSSSCDMQKMRSRIQHLAEMDRYFHCRLLEDKEFHDVFWHYHWSVETCEGWSPSTPSEEIYFQEIHEAIEERSECVLTQKIFLEKYCAHLTKEERDALTQKLRCELGETERWLHKFHPHYEELNRKLGKAYR